MNIDERRCVTVLYLLDVDVITSAKADVYVGLSVINLFSLSFRLSVSTIIATVSRFY